MDVIAISKIYDKDDNNYTFFYEKLVKRGKRYYWDWIDKDDLTLNRNTKVFYFFRKEIPGNLIPFRKKDLRFSTTPTAIIDKYNGKNNYSLGKIKCYF